MMINMASTGRKTYDIEFKKAAVARVLEEGLTAVQVAEELGISATTVQNWVTKVRQGKPLSTLHHRREQQAQAAKQAKELSDAEKLRNYDKLAAEKEKLEKLLAKKEQENEFLKKASAFFASQMDSPRPQGWR